MESQDFLPIQAIDYLEFYVGNARQAAYFFTHGYGLDYIAYAGMETGIRDRASYVVGKGDIRLVLTCPLSPEGPISEHVRKHGDGVKDIAFRVENAAKAFEAATQRGAKPVLEPQTSQDEFGRFTKASIAAYGDTIHSFIEREGYKGIFAPGYKESNRSGSKVGRDTGLTMVDHVVANVELGKMDEWVRYYERILGFSQLIHFTDEAISTEYSALMSKVMQNGTGRVKFPINEPAQGKKKSQIQEYLDYYGGPGAQHIAIATDDIIETVSRLKERGVQFMKTPPTYYEELEGRVGHIDEDMARIKELNILVDRDDEGYLLQIFTRNIVDRPTVFFEIIERKGARGFGEGNFKALFEAIEREQALRGNL